MCVLTVPVWMMPNNIPENELFHKFMHSARSSMFFSCFRIKLPISLSTTDHILGYRSSSLVRRASSPYVICLDWCPCLTQLLFGLAHLSTDNINRTTHLRDRTQSDLRRIAQSTSARPALQAVRISALQDKLHNQHTPAQHHYNKPMTIEIWSNNSNSPSFADVRVAKRMIHASLLEYLESTLQDVNSQRRLVYELAMNARGMFNFPRALNTIKTRLDEAR